MSTQASAPAVEQCVEVGWKNFWQRRKISLHFPCPTPMGKKKEVRKGNFLYNKNHHQRYNWSAALALWKDDYSDYTRERGELEKCGIGVSEVLSSKVITLCSSSNFNNWPFECSLEFDKLRLHSISAQYSRTHSIDMQSGKGEDELIMINPST